MKSHEFITEAGIDDEITQAQTQPGAKVKGPYNRSGLGNFIGGTVGVDNPATTTLGKIGQATANAISPTNVANKLNTVAGGIGSAWKAGANSGLGGVQVAYKGSPADQAKAKQQPGQQADDNQQLDDKQVADYLKKAAGGKPLQQNTGNQQLDALLKNAGLLK